MLTLSLFDKGDGDDLLHRHSGLPLFEQYPQDGVQDMLWHVEGFWENSESNMISLAFPQPSPLKQAKRSSCERCPPHLRSRGASLSPRQRDTESNPDTKVLLSFPQFITLTTYSLTCHILHKCALLIKPGTKYSGLTISSNLYFLMEPPVQHKTYKFVCFSPINFCRFNF